MSDAHATGMRRRDLLALIGTAAGGAAMYQAMTSLGLAAESTYAGPIKLDGDPKGASVLILGAGLAGMAAALELRKAGYRVSHNGSSRTEFSHAYFAKLSRTIEGLSRAMRIS